MFSFQIGITAQEEEEPSSAESAILPDDVKAKLQEVFQLLSQDIGELVRDAEPIRTILKTLEGQLPESIEEVLIPAAFIESHRVQVFKAQKRLADRAQQEQISKQRDDFKNQLESTCAEIDSLKKTKSELESKRDSLLQVLNRVNQEIDVVDNDLARIQPTIIRLEREKQEQARQAYQLHKSMQPIPGSASDDNKVIQKADKICLRAMNAIQNALGSL